VDDYRLEIHDLWSGSPVFVQDLSPVEETGGVFPDQIQAVPTGVDVVGSHIVFSVGATGQSASRYSAFSVDRHPIP
jgi:hypothetical protein